MAYSAMRQLRIDTCSELARLARAAGAKARVCSSEDRELSTLYWHTNKFKGEATVEVSKTGTARRGRLNLELFPMDINGLSSCNFLPEHHLMAALVYSFLEMYLDKNFRRVSRKKESTARYARYR